MAKLSVKEDPPVRTILKAPTPADTTANVRDIMANLVGGGHQDLNSSEARANFLSLSKLVGQPAAQKLATQAMLFNQRPGATALPAATRVQQFYDTGSNDPDVDSRLKKIRAFGSGVLGGINTSPNMGSRVLSGREAPIAQNTMVVGDPIPQARVLLRNAK